MAYTSGIFYMDYVNGSDAVRDTLVGVVFSNPSGTTVLGTKIGHGLITGACITVSGCTQAYANTVWKITRVDDDTFTVDTALWASWTGADVTGDVVPFGGQSWADAWKTMSDGATAARVQPGDTIRIAKSGDPVSTTLTSTWVTNDKTGGALTATVALTSSTDATPIVVTKAAHGFLDGQIVHISGHTTNLKANGVWVVANKTDNTFELEGSSGSGAGAGSDGTARKISELGIVMSETVSPSIENCGEAWTAGTNVTSATRTAGGKSGAYYCIIITAAGHAGAGILAKQALASSLDLSAYQQISFWIRTQTTVLASGDLLIKLYSDTDCTVEVESLTVPAINVTNAYYPVVINKGSALSATVQGIAVYATKALASKTYWIENIIACKAVGNAKCITHNTLISKSSAAEITSEPWTAIDCIHRKVIIFSGSVNGIPVGTNGTRGYFGASSTGSTLYIREPILTPTAATANAQVQIVQDSGTAGSLITYKGGWDTGTNIRDGITIYSGQNGYGYGIYEWNKNYISMDYIGLVRYGYGFYIYDGDDSAYNIPLSSHHNGPGLHIYQVTRFIFDVIGCVAQNGAAGIQVYNNTVHTYLNTIYYACGNTASSAHGLSISVAANHVFIGTIYKCNGNNGSGVYGGCYHQEIADIQDISYNYSSGLSVDYGCIIGHVTGQKNTNYLILYNGTGYYQPLKVYNVNSGGGHTATINSNGRELQIYNLITADSDIFYEAGMTAAGSMASIGKVNSDIYDNRIWWDDATAIMQSAVTQTGDGYAWKMAPGTTRTVTYPISLPIAQVLVAADKLVTVNAYMKKDHATNVACKLAVRGYQLAGLTASEYSDTKGDDTDWELLSFTFTPTEIGVVEIEAVAWYVAGASYCYIDTLVVSQAA